MVDARHKSVQIGDLLRHRLRSGHAIPGTRFYSNNSLARDFGVSAPTAGKILDELCAEGLVNRVHGSGTYVAETAIQAAIQHFLVLAWIELGNPATRDTLRYDMIRGFEGTCTAHGQRAALVNLHDADHLQSIDQFLAEGVAGALVLPPYHEHEMPAAIARVAAAGVPLVYWDDASALPLPPARHDRVAFDNLQTGRGAAEHLLALGHHQFCYAGYAAPRPWQVERLTGCRAALHAAGLRLPEASVCLFEPADLRPTVLTQVLGAQFARGATALITANDKLAAELILAARAIDRRCPADFSVVGVDNRDQAMLTNLTTIDQPGEPFARRAFALLADRRQHPEAPPQTSAVACPLIVRRSTGAPPGTSRN